MVLSGITSCWIAFPVFQSIYLKAKVVKIKFAITFLLLFIGVSLSLRGQSYWSTQGKTIVKENGDAILLRGMGLGGWMLQEG
jgi:hypothetical protein